MNGVTCPRCNGKTQVVAAILYPNPPARILTVPCPFCAATGVVASEAERDRLIADLRQSLEAAKQEIPWIRSQRIFARFRELAGCTEFVIQRVRW